MKNVCKLISVALFALATVAGCGGTDIEDACQNVCDCAGEAAPENCVSECKAEAEADDPSQACIDCVADAACSEIGTGCADECGDAQERLGSESPIASWLDVSVSQR
jgi:hypothetical protein